MFFRQNLDIIQMKLVVFGSNLEQFRQNLDEIQMKFRRNLVEIQTKFRRNLTEIRTDIKTKFRQNLDVSKKNQMFLDTKFGLNFV